MKSKLAALALAGFVALPAAAETITFNLRERTRVSAAVRSALAPGWGQFFNEQPDKGAVIAVTEAAAIASTLILFRKSRRSLDAAHAQTNANSPLYDDFKSERGQAVIAGGVAVAIWLYAMMDAAYYGEPHPRGATDSGWHLESRRADDVQLAYTRRFQ